MALLDSAIPWLPVVVVLIWSAREFLSGDRTARLQILRALLLYCFPAALVFAGALLGHSGWRTEQGGWLLLGFLAMEATATLSLSWHNESCRKLTAAHGFLAFVLSLPIGALIVIGLADAWP
jgi:hypothetical protein